ncbi:WD40 repeat domain-containing protein [Planctomycetaceae bacterium]|nr:WD40 repeat domain-containing protein [Planctomycetaceae bacterium]
MKSPRIASAILCLLLITQIEAQQPSNKYVGHDSAAYSVILSPSGQRLASTGFDGTVRIWNHNTQSMITSFQEHTGIVLTAAFNPDETMLASGGLDRDIRLWDVPKSEPVTVYDVAKFPVTTAVFGREGKFLGLAGAEGKIILWNTIEQKVVAELQSVISDPQFMAIHQDGTSIAIANATGEMEVFSGNELQTRTRLQSHRGGITGLLSSGSSYYFTVGPDNYLRRWPISPPETIRWETPGEQFSAAVVDEGGNRLVTTSTNNKVQIWDVNQGKSTSEVKELNGVVTHPIISVDAQLLIVLTDKQTPHVIQMSDGKVLRSLPKFTAPVTTLALSPNKSQLAAGFADGNVSVMETTEGKELHKFSTGSKPVSQLDWQQSSQQLFAASESGQVQRWEVAKSEKMAEWSTDSPITAINYNSRQNQLAVGSKQGKLLTLSADKLEVVTEFPTQSVAVTQVDLRSNGDALISSDADGLITIWETKTSTPREHYSFEKGILLSSVRLGDGSSFTVTSTGEISRQKPLVNYTAKIGDSAARLMALSDNMNELAIVCEDGSLKTFNGNNGSPGKEYEGHDGTITAIAYAPGNNQFYAANQTGMIFEWRTSNHRLEQAYGVGKPIRDLQLTRDSSLLIATTNGQEIRCYPVERAEPNERIDPEKLSPTLQELTFATEAPLTYGIREDHETGWSITPDGKVQAWRMADSKSVARLNGHGGQVYGVAFSPDGSRLVSVSSDKSVRLWDPAEKKAIKTLATYDQVLYDVVYSPDGKSIFVCGADRVVRQLEAESGQLMHSYEGNDETLYTIDITNDGKQICAAGTGLGPDREIVIWNVGGSQPFFTLPMKTDSIYALQFDGVGESLFAVGYNGHIERFSVRQKKTTGSLDVPYVLYSGCLSADEKSLILASDRKEILTYPLP